MCVFLFLVFWDNGFRGIYLIYFLFFLLMRRSVLGWWERERERGKLWAGLRKWDPLFHAFSLLLAVVIILFIWWSLRFWVWFWFWFWFRFWFRLNGNFHVNSNHLSSTTSDHNFKFSSVFFPPWDMWKSYLSRFLRSFSNLVNLAKLLFFWKRLKMIDH